jgi:hypothetical protein
MEVRRGSQRKCEITFFLPPCINPEAGTTFNQNSVEDSVVGRGDSSLLLTNKGWCCIYILSHKYE